MFFQSVEARFKGGERVANFVGDASSQSAERGEFLLSFEKGLATHQFGSQRRDRVTVNHPANHDDQAHEHHDAHDETASEIAERSMGVGKKGGSGRVAGISHFLYFAAHSLRLNFK